MRSVSRLPLRIEQAELDLLGVGREQREVHAASVPGRPKRMGQPGFDAQLRHEGDRLLFGVLEDDGGERRQGQRRAMPAARARRRLGRDADRHCRHSSRHRSPRRY